METDDPRKIGKKPRLSLSGKHDEPRGNFLMGVPYFNLDVSCLKLISTAHSSLNRSYLFFPAVGFLQEYHWNHFEALVTC